MIRSACPSGSCTAPPGRAGRSPETGSTDSPGAVSSLRRTAKPSIADIARAGTSSGLRSSAASRRPAASASGTCTAGATSWMRSRRSSRQSQGSGREADIGLLTTSGPFRARRGALLLRSLASLPPRPATWRGTRVHDGGMREIRFDHFGGPEVLTLHDDAPRPEPGPEEVLVQVAYVGDRKSTRLNSSHVAISYAVFCLN